MGVTLDDPTIDAIKADVMPGYKGDAEAEAWGMCSQLSQVEFEISEALVGVVVPTREDYDFIARNLRRATFPDPEWYQAPGAALGSIRDYKLVIAEIDFPDAEQAGLHIFRERRANALLYTTGRHAESHIMPLDRVGVLGKPYSAANLIMHAVTMIALAEGLNKAIDDRVKGGADLWLSEDDLAAFGLGDPLSLEELSSRFRG